jgi:hypothetical protein
MLKSDEALDGVHRYEHAPLLPLEWIRITMLQSLQSFDKVVRLTRINKDYLTVYPSEYPSEIYSGTIVLTYSFGEM